MKLKEDENFFTMCMRVGKGLIVGTGLTKEDSEMNLQRGIANIFKEGENNENKTTMSRS